jgi:hypothetical protein
MQDMRRGPSIEVFPVRRIHLALLILAAISAQATSLQITPTTTLNAETGNNTSAASAWKTSPTGDVAPGNISKVDHRTLLYPGATTQIYTNIMFWFGQSNHINVGYSSNDYNQVKRQVDDHLSRGIAGTIVDWYGTGHPWDNSATMYLKQYAESVPGYPFKFAIMEDKGALLNCSHTAGCDVNAQLVSDLTYIVQTYGSSPAYMKFNNEPAIFFFGLEAYSINWSLVKSKVPGNPLFIFENPSGYTQAATAGAYSWVMINTGNSSDWMQSYLVNFYQQGQSYPAQHTFGATWKGFNDKLAAWSLNRIMNQQCGQVWLNTWNEVGKHYNSGNQLESMQIVTWNDYEEGTEIETGIDNCLSVNASGAGQQLSWNVNGNENTVDHYTVFVSEDGQNLMPLADVASGIHALDLSQFGLGQGNYVLYVKAVGKPSFLNHISGAVSFNVGASANPPNGTGAGPTAPAVPTTPATPADFGVAASPASATIKTGESANFAIHVAASTGSVAGTVALSCSGLPAMTTCNFSPSKVQPGSTAATANLTISTNATTAALIPVRKTVTPMFALWMPFAGLVLLPAGIRSSHTRLLMCVALLVMALLLFSSCGGGTGSKANLGNTGNPSNTGSGSQPAGAGTPAGSYTITITADGGVKRTATVNLTVQ